MVMQEEAARMNWCLNDVLEMHSEIALRPRGGHWGDNETDTVYPDGKATPEGFEPLDNIPINPPSTPTEAPSPDPSAASHRGAFPWLSSKPGPPSQVAPASYESRPASAAEASAGVYPATGVYGSTAPVYPATPSYRSTGY
jgi:hypothetical protein